MDLNTLRGALREQPFKPFTIRLADGQSEFIPHPEFVAVGPRIVVVVRKDNTVTHIEPLLIVSLDHAGNGRKGGNGPTRRKPRNP
jgi:hypothetical protein